MSTTTTSTSETTEFRLPDVGEGLTEAEIVTWRVVPGDTVAVNDPLAEIETAKSLVELSSPRGGTVGELCAAAGETVPVGSVLLRFEGDPAVGTGDADERPAVLVGPGPRTEAVRRRRRRDRPAAPGSDAATAGDSSGAAPAPGCPDARRGEPDPPPAPRGRGGWPTGSRAEPPPAAPAVRRLARELGIALTAVTATGPEGRVLREDVLAHLTTAGSGQPAAPPAPAAGAGESAGVVPAGPGGGRRSDGEVRVPVRGVRKATAAAVTSSAFTAPHVTEFLDVDVTGTVELVERLRADPRLAGSRVTPLLVVARAVLAVVRAHPDINARWSAETGEIVHPPAVNLGIAAATDRGLIVPNIAGADRLDLPGLARALDALVETARAGRTPVSDLTGGTITITNIGVFGVDAATPILNPGEAAILCLGAFRRRPWVVDDEVVPRWTTRLSLSFDHRLVDGELGSQVLCRIGAVLTDPAWELAMA